MASHSGDSGNCASLPLFTFARMALVVSRSTRASSGASNTPASHQAAHAGQSASIQSRL